METIKLQARIGADRLLQIPMPANLENTSVEVVVVIQPLASEEAQPKYNALGQPTTKKSIQAAVAKMQQLRQAVALDVSSISGMIEEGRRF